MKRLKYFLLILILLSGQSCVTYQKVSVELSEAVDKGKVKVVPTFGNHITPKNIAEKQGCYYGISGSDSILIDEGQLQGVYLKDKQKSNRRTFFFVLVAVPVAAIAGTFLFWAVIGPTI